MQDSAWRLLQAPDTLSLAQAKADMVKALISQALFFNHADSVAA